MEHEDLTWNFFIFFNHLIPMISIIICIGLSNMVEYYVSPTKGIKLRNAPEDKRIICYNGWYHAFKLGVFVSYQLILPLFIFDHVTEIIVGLNILIISMPVFCSLMKFDEKYPFLSHYLIYIVSIVMLSISIFWNIEIIPSPNTHSGHTVRIHI